MSPPVFVVASLPVLVVESPPPEPEVESPPLPVLVVESPPPDPELESPPAVVLVLEDEPAPVVNGDAPSSAPSVGFEVQV